MSKFINISAPRRLQLELHICKEPLRAIRERSRKYVGNRTSKTNKQKHQRHYQGCSSHILASPNGIAIHIATFISRSLKQGTLGSFLVSTWFIYYHHSLKFSEKKICFNFNSHNSEKNLIPFSERLYVFLTVLERMDECFRHTVNYLVHKKKKKNF